MCVAQFFFLVNIWLSFFLIFIIQISSINTDIYIFSRYSKWISGEYSEVRSDDERMSGCCFDTDFIEYSQRVWQDTKKEKPTAALTNILNVTLGKLLKPIMNDIPEEDKLQAFREMNSYM